MNDKKNSNHSQQTSNYTIEGIVEMLKTNSEVLKGIAASLFGAYLISIKYYVVVDFLLFAAGVGFVLYGLVCLKVAKVRGFLSRMINKLSNTK